MTEAIEQLREARPRRLCPYPEYKDSGIEWLGEIPAHWKAKRFKTILARNDSGVWGEDSSDDGVVVLRSTEQAVDGNWTIEKPARRRLSAREADQARLEVGDLVVTKSSGSERHIGKTSIVDESVAAMECCFSNFMQRLRLSGSIPPRFYWYLLNSPVAREQLVFFSTTTTGLGNLNGSILGSICVPVMSPDEQRAIVAFLDHETAKIDALLARKERLIELLQEKRAALITRAVTRGLNPNAPMKDSGVEWLGEIPAHWEVKALGKTLSSLMDFRGRTPTKLGMEWGGEIPAVSAVNVRDGVLDLSRGVNSGNQALHDRWMAQGPTRKGDVLFTTEAPLGNTAVVPNDELYILSQRVVLFRTDSSQVVPEYLQRFLSCSRFRQGVEAWATGSTAEGVKRRYLMAMPVCVPPVGEQHAIAVFLERETSGTNTLIAKIREAIDRLKEFRTALISAAVTGKIDVREEAR